MDIKKICLKINCIIIIIVIILSSYALYLPCGNTGIQNEQSQAQPQDIQIEEPIVEENNINNIEIQVEEEKQNDIQQQQQPIAAEENVTIASTEEKTKVTSRGGSSLREEEEEKTKNKKVSLGVYKLTAYCGCSKCCGKSTGITASGVKAKANHTIAAPKNFAFGTKIEIDGCIYVVEDRGGAIKGNKIDVYFNSHSEALSFGVKYTEIYRVD